MSGTGAYVNVGDKQILLDSMFKSITDTIEYTRQFADEMRGTLSTGISNLNDVVGTYNPIIADIDTEVKDIDRPALPARPAWAALILDDQWPTDFPLAPVLKEYGNIDFEIRSPSAPKEIDGSFGWTEGEYTSGMYLDLFNRIHYDILHGGTGLSQAVYNAIVSREKEQRRRNQETAYQNGLDDVGETGFNLADGHVAAFQADVVKEIINKDQDAANNLLIKDFDVAVEQTRFAVTSGLEIEKMLRATFDALQNRSLDAKKAAKEFLIRVYAENVKRYLAGWEGEKVRLEALKAKIEGISSINEGHIKAFLGRAEVFTTRIKAIVEKNKALIESRKGEVEVYTAEVNAVVQEYSMLVEEIKVHMDGVRLKITKAVEEAKLKLEAYTNKAQLTEKVAEAVATIASQAVASALGAINTHLGNSYSGQESNSTTQTNGARITEVHQYQDGTKSS